MNQPTPHRSAFTLIELLVVIAVIAILAIVVILTLNPAQLLMQSRDSNRVSDLGTMTSALGVYTTDQSNGSLGSASTVYVSIADPTATSTAGDQCQGLGLPSLPSTYSYHCAASSTFRNANGQGWIPVNFSSVSFGSPLGSLAVDPVNQSSSREYYTYTTNGTQFEFTAPMESQKYGLGGSNDLISNDGGTLASVYEKGTKLGLEPLDYGDSSLVGFWSFEEGSSSVAYDYSGSNATGTWTGTATGTNGYYSAGKVGSWAGAFDGASTYVRTSWTPNVIGGITLSAWVKLSTTIVSQESLYGSPGGSSASEIRLSANGLGDIALGGYSNGVNAYRDFPFGVASSGIWYFVTVTFDGTTVRAYNNGSLIGSQSLSAPPATWGSNLAIGRRDMSNGQYFNGLIDDVRIYNRALSAAQIAAMYAGGK